MPLFRRATNPRLTNGRSGRDVSCTGTTCRDAVQILVDAVGSASLQRSSPLGRRLRDVNMIAQHGLANRRVWLPYRSVFRVFSDSIIGC
jgi:hypothetical protein